MTDGQPAETPPGTPSRRALGAMESAVPPRPGGPGRPPAATSSAHARLGPAATAAGSGPDRPGPARQPARRRPDRWLLSSVVAASVLVVVAAAALAVSLSRNSRACGAFSLEGRGAPGPLGAARHERGRQRHRRPRRRSGRRLCRSSAPSRPSSGSAGESIQVAGTNFLSSDGQIVATFNGQVAPTSCPAPNTCTVTVPPQSGSSSAQVSITTASGTSNAVTFTYG